MNATMALMGQTAAMADADKVSGRAQVGRFAEGVDAKCLMAWTKDQ